MNASLALVAIMAVLYACGIYLILERSLTRVLVGFILASNATTLLLIIVAGPGGSAPIIGPDSDPGGFADPLPQALVLTAIVISFGVTAFLLALIYRSWRLAHQDDVADDRDDVALRSGAPAVRSEDVDDESEAAELATEFGDEPPEEPSGTAGATQPGDPPQPGEPAHEGGEPR
ncbi:MAG TPA: Na(+)/H(+) antiporter subunit C [Microbacteriaceae bacterium]|nr:Na(+)/H(+) antiporter subunit C [Microbacteriaceae bacterium]